MTHDETREGRADFDMRMTWLRALAGFALLTLAAVGCASPVAGSATLADIDATLDPMRTWFDAHADRPRALLILSPL